MCLAEETGMSGFKFYYSFATHKTFILWMLTSIGVPVMCNNVKHFHHML